MASMEFEFEMNLASPNDTNSTIFSLNLKKHNISIDLNNYEINAYESRSTKVPNQPIYLFIIQILSGSNDRYFAIHSDALCAEFEQKKYLMRFNKTTKSCRIFRHISLDVLPYTHLPSHFIQKHFGKPLASSHPTEEVSIDESYLQKKLRLVNSFGSAKGKRIMHNRLEGMSAMSFSEMTEEDSSLLDLTLNETSSNSTMNESLLSQNSSLLSTNQDSNITPGNLSISNDVDNLYVPLDSKSETLRDLVLVDNIVPSHIIEAIQIKDPIDDEMSQVFGVNDLIPYTKLLDHTYNMIKNLKNDPKNIPVQYNSTESQVKLLIYLLLMLNFATNHKKLFKSKSKVQISQLIPSEQTFSKFINGYNICIGFIIKKYTIDLTAAYNNSAVSGLQTESELSNFANEMMTVDFGSRSLPARMFDRMVCHMSALMLILNGFKMDLSPMCTSFNFIDSNKLVALLKIMRCHIKKPSSKFIGVLPTIVQWKLPLPSPVTNMKRRSKQS
ncbi:MAG: hypothetical protein MHMPM18_001290 [Marteilia pararefringens]